MRTSFKIIAIVLAVGMLIPQQSSIPVQGATAKDWHPHSFWYSPWGKSGVHKGIDIFAKKGTLVVSSTSGLVVFAGNIALGGNFVAVLGPKWRIHYYAHLQRTDVNWLNWVSRGEAVGSVGDSGNAVGKPPHLHYSVLSLIPYPWRFSTEPQGWKKMFFIDPNTTLR